ncbi:MAG TPA: ABC transporter ATP-binding protein [Rubrobacter sp.]|nr:ABC transporter ATP-binding protein [Rubrobacter sp.]
MLCALGATAMMLAGPWLIRDLVRIIAAESQGGGWKEAVGPVSWLTLGLVASFLLRAAFLFLMGYVAHIVAWSYVRDLTVALYEHLQRQSLGYYGDRQTGELLTRLSKDTADMEPFMAHDVPDIIVNVSMLLGISAILFSLDPALAALTLVPLPLLAFFVVRFSDRMHEAFTRAREHYGALCALLQDNLSGMKEIQVFSREAREKRRVRGQAQRHTRDRLKANKLEALWTPGIEVIAGAGTVIVAWFGGRAALQGALPVEDLVAFVLYLGLFYQPLRLLARTSEGFQEARTGAQHVWEVLDVQPDVVDPPEGVDSGRVRGQVHFEGVDFEYESDLPVLNNVSFEIKPGQTLALVGPTGAGKSTIVSLIPRFYDPKRGRVLIDGIDISEMRLASVRRNVSMVLQDTFLFAGTVKENLRFGNERASDEEIVAAAKAANAHSFIEALPRGYDTRVGERGVRLSGGQKQRLSIARAILNDAPILILDEATSSVDTQTEEEIQKALHELMQERTAIVIAHRLSTVRHADLIAVLEGGSIVELGTHEHLMRCKGLYRNLYDRQFGAAA